MFRSESHIIEKVKAKDQRAFEVLYDKYSSRVYGVAMRMTGSAELSEEIMQEVFLKLWNNIEKYDSSKSKLFTWLYQITRNTTLNTLELKREKSKRLINYTEEFKIDPSINKNIDTLDLKGMVKNLDQKYVDVIELFYFRAYTFKEASEALDVPIGTLKTRVRFALSN